MKRRMLVLAVIVMGLLAALPMTSYAARGGGGRGGFHGGGFRGGGWRGGFWYGPGAFLGPGYYYPYYPYSPYYYPQVPPPVYGAPPGYAAPDPAYAYPPPPAAGMEGAAGQPGVQGSVLTVPGQWVNGTWVPEHQVQVPPAQ